MDRSYGDFKLLLVVLGWKNIFFGTYKTTGNVINRELEEILGTFFIMLEILKKIFRG